MTPLSVIGQIKVPNSVRSHRFVREANMINHVRRNDLERVIGTDNHQKSPTCQLYGWAKNVPKHTDETGWSYFVPVTGRPSLICCDGINILARNGDVCRLDDFRPHYTFDETARVCLYIGPYKEPCDAWATAALKVGMDQLASGAYEAPRVREGFRFPADDECYALISGHSKVLLKAEAERIGAEIARCGECENVAWRLDDLYPWHQEKNCCKQHMRSKAVA